MKIALMIFADFPGGAAPARRIHTIGKALALLDHQVYVVVPQRFDKGDLHEKLEGLEIYWGAKANHQTWNSIDARLKARIATIQLIDKLSKEGLDWLLLSNPSLDGLPMLTVARRRGTKVIAMYDDIRDIPRDPTFEDRLRLIWMELADKIIPRLTHLNLVISSFLEARIFSVSPHKPVFTLPPVVDMDTFRSAPARVNEFKKQWQLNDTLIISYIGTYWHQEGVAVLLKSARLLCDKGDQFKIVLSGASFEGSDCDDVLSIINQLSLEDVVVETGWLSVIDVVSAMTAADILVVPKIQSDANVAGVSTKLPEYLSIGKPVVASRLGDYPLYLTHGEDSLLCEPGDPESLALALHQLLHDECLRERLARNALITARTHFEMVNVVGRLATRLNEISTIA